MNSFLISSDTTDTRLHLAKGTNTAVFDVAKEGTLLDILEDEQRKVISTWTPSHKLRYAWQITKAISDLHSIGNIHNSASISHTDISPDQILWIDGMFKVCSIDAPCTWCILLYFLFVRH